MSANEEGGVDVGAQSWLGPGWDPSGDLVAMQQEMNRLLESLLGRSPGQVQPVERTWAPLMDVCETRIELSVLVELPRISLDKIQIEIVEDVLSIRRERQPDPTFRQDQLIRMERRYGPFCRNLNLPSIADAQGVRAMCRDGVLEIRLPKRLEVTPQIISVEAA